MKLLSLHSVRIDIIKQPHSFTVCVPESKGLIYMIDHKGYI